jgi:histidinol phosphatase-like enzyme (inositol monophosphatase family)
MRTFLNQLLDISGEIIEHYYHKRNYRVEQKENNTPVTMADRESEQAMRKLINDHFSDHGIIGEEFGSENTDKEYVWVLDPIDGTIAFIHGVPLFVTLIALLKNGQPILGAINQPIARLRCEGDNTNAWLNGETICARAPQGIDQLTLLATDIANIGKFHNKKGFSNLLEQARLFRTWGDGFGYILLATGKADIMLDARMAPWDILPVIPVVRGAGAKITTFSGGDPVIGNSGVSAHASIHDEVLRILNP